MTGKELAGKIMAIRPQIPVILCTRYSENITESLAREAGISALAYKPLRKDQLARIVRKVLDAKAQ